jgi:arabinose-5-phosphate isomerase
MISAARAPAQRTAGAGETSEALELARNVLEIEADAIRALMARLDHRFLDALSLIQRCLAAHGRVIVSGIGKSGHIARKIASTLSSTGTPAYFVHPAEASHGDLGMIRQPDVLVAISYSGESEELMRIVPFVKREGAKLIAITGNAQSALAREADVVLDAGVEKEACPLNLAPTASTTAALALGDALAVALLDARGFSTTDYARQHPRGSLYRQAQEALKHIAAVMRGIKQVPMVQEKTDLRRALAVMTKGGMGMVAIVDKLGRVKGIFTDGDLRRNLDVFSRGKRTRIDDVMTPNPRTIGKQALAAAAVELMERHKITQLLVTDEAGVLVGALNLHDLFRARVL